MSKQRAWPTRRIQKDEKKRNLWIWCDMIVVPCGYTAGYSRGRGGGVSGGGVSGGGCRGRGGGVSGGGGVRLLTTKDHIQDQGHTSAFCYVVYIFFHKSLNILRIDKTF